MFLVPVLGDLLGHEVGLQLSSLVGVDKGSDVILGDVHVSGPELGHVLLQLDNSHAGKLRILQYQISQF